MKTKLSVNINKIATLRNSRGGNVPDLLKVAVDCEQYGAQGITVHPRPDERHIRKSDVGILREMNQTGVLSKTGKDVVRAVAAGEATLGLTQATELIGTKGVQFAGYVAGEVQVVSVYSGAVSSYAAAPDVARRFIHFLKSPASADRFTQAGWSVD